MVVDGDASCQPSVGIMLLAEPLQPSGTAHAIYSAIDPKGEENPGSVAGLPGLDTTDLMEE